MNAKIATILAVLSLGYCSNPKDTPLPQDIAGMDSIKPAMEKLQPEEKELLGSYVLRHTESPRI